MTTLPSGQNSIVERARQGPRDEGYTRVNVGEAERVLSGVVGVPLIALGLRQKSLGGLAIAAFGGALAYRAATGHCHVYAALNLDSEHDAHAITHMHKGVKVHKSFTVNRSPADCYQFWRKFENLPRFMTHLKSVTVLDDRRSRWEAKAPLGSSVSWEAEILTDRPNELISWKSVGDSDIDNAGSVSFRPAPVGRGTEVTVEINYEPPAGRVGQTLAWLLGEEPEVQVREDLRRYKQVMEAGEIPTVAGQASGRGRD